MRVTVLRRTGLKIPILVLMLFYYECDDFLFEMHFEIIEICDCYIET